MYEEEDAVGTSLPVAVDGAVVQKYSVGKSILKGLSSAGIATLGVAAVAGGTFLSDPQTAVKVFKDVPVAVPFGAIAFQFLGTAFVNFAKQKLLK